MAIIFNVSEEKNDVIISTSFDIGLYTEHSITHSNISNAMAGTASVWLLMSDGSDDHSVVGWKC